MNKYIESNYYYLATTYQNRNTVLKNRNVIWGNKVIYQNNNFLVLKTNNRLREEMESQMAKLYKSKKIDLFLSYMDKQRIDLKKSNIDVIYQVAIDYSERKLVTSDKVDFQTKKILTITLKYYNQNGPLLTLGHSDSFCEFKIKDLDKLIKFNLPIIYKYSRLALLNKIPTFDYIVFSPFTAAIVNHELFGHIFECDNYNEITNLNKKLELPKFISVYDSPNIKLGGYYQFDDAGNVLENEILVNNGTLINLITGFNAIGANRIRAGENLLLPRVTNTVLSPKYKIAISDSYKKTLFIEGISQAVLKSKANAIVIIVDSAYINCENSTYKLPKFKIQLNASELLQNIVAFFGENVRYSTVDCIKKGQRCGGVGIISPGMIVQLPSP